MVVTPPDLSEYRKALSLNLLIDMWDPTVHVISRVLLGEF
jgi:hypothetical protein